MLQSIFRSNFQQHGSMFPLTNSEIAWKTLNAIIFKILVVGEQADFTLVKIKKRTFLSILSLKKCKEFGKKSQKSTHLLWCMKCMSQVRYWYIINLRFLQPPYLHKMVCFLNSWKQIVKTIVQQDAWLIELSFWRNNLFNTCARKEILSK